MPSKSYAYWSLLLQCYNVLKQRSHGKFLSFFIYLRNCASSFSSACTPFPLPLGWCGLWYSLLGWPQCHSWCLSSNHMPWECWLNVACSIARDDSLLTPFSPLSPSSKGGLSYGFWEKQVLGDLARQGQTHPEYEAEQFRKAFRSSK